MTIFILSRGLFNLGKINVEDRRTSSYDKVSWISTNTKPIHIEPIQIYNANLSPDFDSISYVMQMYNDTGEQAYRTFVINCDFIRENICQISQASSLFVDIIYLRLVTSVNCVVVPISSMPIFHETAHPETHERNRGKLGRLSESVWEGHNGIFQEKRTHSSNWRCVIHFRFWHGDLLELVLAHRFHGDAFIRLLQVSASVRMWPSVDECVCRYIARNSGASWMRVFRSVGWKVFPVPWRKCRHT